MVQKPMILVVNNTEDCLQGASTHGSERALDHFAERVDQSQDIRKRQADRLFDRLGS